MTVTCACQEPGHFNSGIPGILAHIEGRTIVGKVERCDACKRFNTDEDARKCLVRYVNRPVDWYTDESCTVGRPFGDIFAELNARLVKMDWGDDRRFADIAEGGIGNQTGWADPGETPIRAMPDRVKWIACYAVTGGSEGHYIHVDLILPDDSRRLIGLCKTFSGMEMACEIAAAVAIFLGA